MCLSACGEAPQTPPIGSEVPIDGALPNGDWQGTLTGYSGQSYYYRVHIANNTITTMRNDGAFEATQLDQFEFTGPIGAKWLGLQQQTIGQCSAQGGQFLCNLSSGMALEGRRTLHFYTNQLSWNEDIHLTGETSTPITGSLPSTRR